MNNCPNCGSKEVYRLKSLMSPRTAMCKNEKCKHQWEEISYGGEWPFYIRYTVQEIINKDCDPYVACGNSQNPTLENSCPFFTVDLNGRCNCSKKDMIDPDENELGVSPPKWCILRSSPCCKLRVVIKNKLIDITFRKNESLQIEQPINCRYVGPCTHKKMVNVVCPTQN